MDELVKEQIAYYRARAGEYDADLRRLVRYESLGGSITGPGPLGEPERQLDAIATALLKLAPFGDVLELACGTGWWTQLLAAHANTVTAVDAAEEMVALNRQRVTQDNVRYILADVFRWKPDRRYDLVFFSYWLSHVPAERLVAFWRMVGEALQPGGTVFFIDELGGPRDFEHRINQDAVQRTLRDGRTFRAVKIFYSPEDLQEKLERLGWIANVKAAGPDFYFGACRLSTS